MRWPSRRRRTRSCRACTRSPPPPPPSARSPSWLLYLASTALVTPFGGDLGQALLSGLWAATGLTALAVGLVRDARTLRLGALALLATTIGKVFLYDLAALQSLYRVASFIENAEKPIFLIRSSTSCVDWAALTLTTADG